MQCIAREEGMSHVDDCEGKKKAAFYVKVVPLRYTREMGNMMNGKISCKADHVDVSE